MPTVDGCCGGGTGPTAAGRREPPEASSDWQATRARNSSYGSSGGGGGGRSFRETVLSVGTTAGDVTTSWTGPDEGRVDGTDNDLVEEDEEVDRPLDVEDLVVTVVWTDGDGDPSST